MLLFIIPFPILSSLSPMLVLSFSLLPYIIHGMTSTTPWINVLIPPGGTKSYVPMFSGVFTIMPSGATIICRCSLTVPALPRQSVFPRAPFKLCATVLSSQIHWSGSLLSAEIGVNISWPIIVYLFLSRNLILRWIVFCYVLYNGFDKFESVWI